MNRLFHPGEADLFVNCKPWSNRFRLLLPCFLIGIIAGARGAEPLTLTDDNPLALPVPGAHQLRVLSSNLLELTLITTKAPDPAKLKQWDFVDAAEELRLPAPSRFTVEADGKSLPVAQVGFKRRVLYAPLSPRDLRIANHLYLKLSATLADQQQVEVKNKGRELWPDHVRFAATLDPLRFNPAIHVNQVGYAPAFPKSAMVGYFAGSLGELDVPKEAGFQLIEHKSGRPVHSGKLMTRPESGFNIEPPPYQKVLEADFTTYQTPGEYRLLVPGLGTSHPFLIHEGVPAALARTYALGLYHQRCGTDNALPFTRFTHEPCHTAPAEIPTSQFTETQSFLARSSADYTNSPRHKAAQLRNVSASLYPFVKRGRIEVTGGHHDAGDYSKYTINSAALIHSLVFAVDVMPDVGSLDNLGLPESGDGRSDLLQEAKWEADFLAKMQDDDGGFFFLVYPRNRQYENDVPPDRGDPQVVWPKTTAVTAAAVAALAQTASSPLFKAQFPEAARAYLEKARKGWAFLERALARHGKDRSYQKITHYGHQFLHDDELAWAACELFLATGEETFHKKLLQSFDPADPETRRWGWWRLSESYGNAIRSYAFAQQANKRPAAELDARFASRCRSEVISQGDDLLRWAKQSSYGTSFPSETKRFRGGGWYFSSDQAFELVVALCARSAADTEPAAKELLGAIVSNLNYEAGCNPVNVCYVTGLGWRRQREMVSQAALHDRRVLPPSGLPLGNIQAAFMWLDLYQKELGGLSFPPDGSEKGPYPLYDRWADTFNVQTEFVVINQARALAATSFLMARTSLKKQPWRTQPANIELARNPGRTEYPVEALIQVGAGLDLKEARIVWEAEDHAPTFGKSLALRRRGQDPKWIEAEAQWPDGRRVFAVTNLFGTARIDGSSKANVR